MQQSKNDCLNIIGKQIQNVYGIETNDRVQEKLDVVNNYWNSLQDKAIHREGTGINPEPALQINNVDLSQQLINRILQSEDSSLYSVSNHLPIELYDLTESGQKIDCYQLQYAKILTLLTAYNDQLAFENVQDGEKLKHEFYSVHVSYLSYWEINSFL